MTGRCRDEQLDLALQGNGQESVSPAVQSATERLETPSEIRKAKKDIARIMTIKRQRELEAAKQSSRPPASRGRDSDGGQHPASRAPSAGNAASKSASSPATR